MKKTTYNVTVYYLPGSGGAVQSVQIPSDYAEAAVAQAHAHKDIRYWNNGTEYLIEWSSVRSVTISKVIEDVVAPVDAICNDGAEPANPLVLTLISPSESCYNETGGVITFVSTYNGEYHATQYSDDEFNWTFVEQITFNGEDHTHDENVEGTYELTLANGVATLTMTVSYEGYTASQTLTATEVCGNIGG